MSAWRQGSKVRLNVYEGDRPVCQCHNEQDARRIVEALNAAGERPARTIVRDLEVAEGAIRIQASQIKNLMAHRDTVCAQYSELIDALCSKSWLGRDRHASVVALAKRLHDSQRTLRPLELEDVALAAGYCIRKSGHDGPCNGLPRNDCHQEPKS